MKKVVCAFSKMLWLGIFVLLSCTPKQAERAELDFMMQFANDGEVTVVLKEIAEAFTGQNPNIALTLSPGSTNYEEVMKTRMAARDLPDLWTTHGWSVHRYSEYLRPLNDQSFFRFIDAQIAPAITSSTGEVFVLPIDKSIAGIIYSKTVFDRLNIDVDALQTIDALFAAMQTIKDAGITPVHAAGGDAWPLGYIANWAATALLISDEQANEREALKNGIFNAEKWTEVAEFTI